MTKLGMGWTPVAAAVICITGGALMSANAWAVDAGQLTRQAEQQKAKAQEQQSTLPAGRQAGADAGKNQSTFVLRGVKFLGVSTLEEGALQAAVKDLQGRSVTLGDLRQAVDAVMATYTKNERLAYAYLPPQEIKGGVVTIQVVEAKFDGVQFAGSSRASDATVQAFFASLKKGQPLDTAAVERALLLLGDVPGVRADASYAAGQTEGQTALQVKLSEGPLVLGEISLDNQGSRSTGENRLTGSASLQSALGFGESFTGLFSHASGVDYLRVGANAPLGGDGLRVGLSASALNYKLVQPEFTALNGHGRSNVLSADVSQNLVRRRDFTVTARLQYDAKDFDNHANGVSTTKYASNAYTWSVQGQRSDEWLGGGVTTANVSATLGRINLNGSPNQAADAVTGRTQGHYRVYRFNAARVQRIDNQWSVQASYSAQLASKNLDSSERFYLGGASGVRAYPNAEAGGSEGQLGQVELRYAVNESLRVGAFVDGGRVRVNVNNKFPGAAPLNHYWLKGTGVTAQWSPVRNVQVQATWARRIDENPGANAKGLDQDGTKKRNRFWVQASYSF